ncbi:MAG: HEAT repeat domain-containing protein [Nitrospiraceae bacterium]|nr:MAG: HEAT repeat domain-containing protein [Nitrospiraceae bacterium]
MEEQQGSEATIKMIADYMESGFLDNIVDMFRHDPSFYPLLGRLLGDERSRVRIGAVALVETLKEEDSGNVLLAIPGIARLLRDPNATIRGDAAYLLGIIGHKEALPFLMDAADDDHDLVRETIAEAIAEISQVKGPR